ncbi:hypothetical protein HKD37_15G043616 [Glycine soja]
MRPPLVSLNKTLDERVLGRISKGLSNPRSTLGEPPRISKGLSNRRSTLSEPQRISKGFSNPSFALGSSNPRFTLSKSHFSKGSSNPRSTLGESRISKCSSNPRSTLGESCFSKGFLNPRSALGKSRFSKGSLNSRFFPGESRFSKDSSNPRSATCESPFSKGLSNLRFALGEPLWFQVSPLQKYKVSLPTLLRSHSHQGGLSLLRQVTEHFIDNKETICKTHNKTSLVVKGNLNIGPIALLLARILLYNSYLFFVKQFTILHVLQWVNKTQVKILGEELDLSDNLIKALFMLLHGCFLKTSSSSSSSLLAFLSFDTLCSNSSNLDSNSLN